MRAGGRACERVSLCVRACARALSIFLVWSPPWLAGRIFPSSRSLASFLETMRSKSFSVVLCIARTWCLFYLACGARSVFPGLGIGWRKLNLCHHQSLVLLESLVISKSSRVWASVWMASLFAPLSLSLSTYWKFLAFFGCTTTRVNAFWPQSLIIGNFRLFSDAQWHLSLFLAVFLSHAHFLSRTHTTTTLQTRETSAEMESQKTTLQCRYDGYWSRQTQTTTQPLPSDFARHWLSASSHHPDLDCQFLADIFAQSCLATNDTPTPTPTFVNCAHFHTGNEL